MTIQGRVLGLGLGLLALGVGVWILRQTLQQGLQGVIQKSLLDLAAFREGLGERLSRHFAESQERLDRTLAAQRQEMQAGLLSSTQALEAKFQSLEQQVGKRLEVIGQGVEAKLQQNMKEGFQHFEKVQQHLAAAELKLAQLGQVGQSIQSLNSLLQLPHLRGGFGEATLERLLADFLPNGQYELQYAISPGTTERVDAIVRMAHQVLPIDSKFPREQVLPLFESQDPEKLLLARKLLGEFIRAQAKTIADKYIRPEHGTTEMALLFLPSETLYFEVIRDGKLFEHLAKLKVFPVSPNTLSISLHSVSMARDYYDMARGVEKTIEDVKKARRHFEHFERKFDDVGKGLRKAQEAFETASTHLGRYETSVFRLVGEAEATSDDLVEGTRAPLPGALPSPQSSLDF